MEGAVSYTLETLLSDAGNIVTAVIGYMGDYLSFFTTNSALLWVFIGGVAMLGLKLIRGLF